MDKLQQSKRPAKKHQPRGLTIVYEDRDILVVEKPAGMLTIGTERDKSRSVHYLLNDYVRKGNPKSRNRVYVVHRLDQDTSGLLLFAKSEGAKQFLQVHWAQTDKHYLAIVHGRLKVKQGTLSGSLIENAAQRVYVSSDPAKGKPCHTVYQVVRESKAFSLVEIQLLTGRKHQIRVHFAAQGHPVMGDRKYGDGDGMFKRLALHAKSIAFIHPFNKRPMAFDSGMPQDFARFLDKI